LKYFKQIILINIEQVSVLTSTLDWP